VGRRRFARRSLADLDAQPHTVEELPQGEPLDRSVTMVV
jgi:hypothetical protein